MEDFPRGKTIPRGRRSKFGFLSWLLSAPLISRFGAVIPPDLYLNASDREHRFLLTRARGTERLIGITRLVISYRKRRSLNY